jgi:EmrB/QacA subfamily drug resistance transporter
MAAIPQRIEMLGPAEAPREPDRLDPQAWKIIGVVIIAPFMTQMDSTIVNVSLSFIRDDLHSTISTAQWIISGYLLALALMLPLSAWLVDRIGVKRLYLFCFGAFTFASFLCGAAHTMPTLIAARILQGMAGGILAPLAQFMMVRVAGKQMVRVAGYAVAPVLLAPLLGPLLAGVILKYASWHWLFYVNLPIGAIGVLLAAIIIPHDESMLQKSPFDLFGFLTLSPGLSCFLYGFEQFSHHQGSSFLIIGILLILWFLWHARQRKEKALIDIELFKIRTFSVATVTQFLSTGIIYCGQFLFPLYLISDAGLSPTDAGWVLSAMGIGMLCVYPSMGNLTDKFGCRAVSSSGVFVNFLGTLPFLWMAHTQYSAPAAIVGLILRGIGQGATGLPSIAAAYASVPREKLNFATASMNIMQRLGGPILTTALAVVVSYSVPAHSVPGLHSFEAPFVALIILQLLVFGSAIQLPIRLHSDRG